MRANRTLLLVVVIAFSASILPGCGSGIERNAVSGDVELDGKPFTDGLVNFSPAAGTKGPSSGAGVVDGKFSIDDSRGLVAGKYLVRFTAFRETGKTFFDPNRGDVPEQKKLEFNEPPFEIEIQSDGDNHFDFNLTVKS